MTKTVLIADKEEGFLDAVASALLEMEFRVVASSSGYEALNLVQQEDPDLVLFDFEMPDMNGCEFLCACMRFSQTPIIMLAADAGIEERVRSLEIGADDFVTKPVSMPELSLRAQAVLRRSDRGSRQVRRDPGAK